MMPFRHSMRTHDFLPTVGDDGTRLPFSILVALVLAVALFVAACGSGPPKAVKKLTFPLNCGD